MTVSLCSILESVLLVSALSTDALIASFAYGSNKIKIPFWSVQVIAATCTVSLGFSLLLGHLLRPYLPEAIVKFLSALILCFLGISKLLDNLIKSLINHQTALRKEIMFHLHDLNFILYVYANPKGADRDDSKTLSPKESVWIALALSIDSLTAGVGAALGDMHVQMILLLSFLLSSVFILLGSFAGNKCSQKTPAPLSWLGGIFLIILAFYKVLR